MKKLLISLACVISATSTFALAPINLSTITKSPLLACTKAAVPPSDPAFCDQFKSAAQCFCIAHGQSPNLCQNMQAIYGAMKAVGLPRACALQSDTSQQECLDGWTCYMEGGGACNHRCV